MLTRSDGASFTHDARNRLVQFTKDATTAGYLQDSSPTREFQESSTKRYTLFLVRSPERSEHAGNLAVKRFEPASTSVSPLDSEHMTTPS